MLLEEGGASPPRGDFFEFEVRVAHFQDTKAIKQKFAFRDDIDLFAVSEEGPAGTTEGNGAVAEEF
ncbi:MAG: hypothetical protein DMG56_12950 [Acidobacteria bacterium]|nr:MAG: hypothetical protein DMG56_12950 [Acidobacteriota bacterium]